jgi:hypothetical protein
LNKFPIVLKVPACPDVPPPPTVTVNDPDGKTTEVLYKSPPAPPPPVPQKPDPVLFPPDAPPPITSISAVPEVPIVIDPDPVYL